MERDESSLQRQLLVREVRPTQCVQGGAPRPGHSLVKRTGSAVRLPPASAETLGLSEPLVSSRETVLFMRRLIDDNCAEPAVAVPTLQPRRLRGGEGFASVALRAGSRASVHADPAPWPSGCVACLIIRGLCCCQGQPWVTLDPGCLTDSRTRRVEGTSRTISEGSPPGWAGESPGKCIYPKTPGSSPDALDASTFLFHSPGSLAPVQGLEPGNQGLVQPLCLGRPHGDGRGSLAQQTAQRCRPAPTMRTETKEGEGDSVQAPGSEVPGFGPSLGPVRRGASSLPLL